MKFRILLLFAIISLVSFSVGRAASPPTFTSTATVTMTLGGSNVSQAASDAAQAQFLLDYCNAKGLSTATPGATVVADVKAYVKGIVVAYRSDQAASTQRAIDIAGIQP